MRKEMEMFKKQVKKGNSGNYGVEKERIDKEDPFQDEDEEEAPIYQRLLVNTLKSMERTMDYKLELAIFTRKMDAEEVMDWLDALISFFDYEEIPEH